MGTLQPDDGVLDARFIGAVAPLAADGWPLEQQDLAELASITTLYVALPSVVVWGLPMAALGLRLAGVIPFSRVVLHEVDEETSELAPAKLEELETLIEWEGTETLRTALVAGDLNLDAARDFIARLNDPTQGPTDVSTVVAAWRNAMASDLPGEALASVAAALETGIDLSEMNDLRELVAPVMATS